jgi:hypothetical protein
MRSLSQSAKMLYIGPVTLAELRLDMQRVADRFERHRATMERARVPIVNSRPAAAGLQWGK